MDSILKELSSLWTRPVRSGFAARTIESGSYLFFGSPSRHQTEQVIESTTTRVTSALDNSTWKDASGGVLQPWMAPPRAERLTMKSSVSRGTRVYIPLQPEPSENLDHHRLEPQEATERKAAIKLVPVFPSQDRPYYKTMLMNDSEEAEDDEEYSDEVNVFDDQDYLEAENRRRYRGQRQRRKKKPKRVKIKVQHAAGYGAPPAASPAVIILKDNDKGKSAPVYHQRQYGGGYGDVTPVLLGLLPLVLLGGLALGLAIPLNTTAVFGTSGFGFGTGTNVANTINIGGFNITNVFTPTNTNNVMNTNNAGRRRRKRVVDSEYGVDIGTYALDVYKVSMAVMGTSGPAIFRDFVRSAVSVEPFEVINAMTALSRKMQCSDSKSNDCADYVLCDHFTEDFLIYDNNMFMRIGDIFMATLSRWLFNDESVHDILALTEFAIKEQCDQIGHCNVTTVKECQAIT